jgi:hypothetical protein
LNLADSCDIFPRASGLAGRAGARSPGDDQDRRRTLG